MHEGYYVARIYSQTDNQQLLKIMSRPMKNKDDAKFEVQFHASMEPKHQFFLIKVEV